MANLDTCSIRDSLFELSIISSRSDINNDHDVAVRSTFHVLTDDGGGLRYSYFWLRPNQNETSKCIDKRSKCYKISFYTTTNANVEFKFYKDYELIESSIIHTTNEEDDGSYHPHGSFYSPLCSFPSPSPSPSVSPSTFPEVIRGYEDDDYHHYNDDYHQNKTQDDYSHRNDSTSPRHEDSIRYFIYIFIVPALFSLYLIRNVILSKLQQRREEQLRETEQRETQLREEELRQQQQRREEDLRLRQRRREYQRRQEQQFQELLGPRLRELLDHEQHHHWQEEADHQEEEGYHNSNSTENAETENMRYGDVLLTDEEQRKQNRRFKILTNIIHKKVLPKTLKIESNKHDYYGKTDNKESKLRLTLPHEEYNYSGHYSKYSSAASLSDKETKPNSFPSRVMSSQYEDTIDERNAETTMIALKDDIHAPSIRSIRRALNINQPDEQSSSSLYSPKVCPICIEPYKEGDEIAWSKNESCLHAFHLDCIMEWLMENDDCPMCRRDYFIESVSESKS